MLYTHSPSHSVADIIWNMWTRDENFVKISRIASALERTYPFGYLMNFQSTRFIRLISCIKSIRFFVVTFFSINGYLPYYVCSIHLINSKSLFYLIKQWLMRATSIGSNALFGANINSPRSSTDLIHEAKWPSKFNWKGHAHVRKWFFDRLIRQNIRRCRREMRSFPRHVCQNENEIFCRSTSGVYVCRWESQRRVSRIQKSQGRANGRAWAPKPNVFHSATRICSNLHLYWTAS